MSKKFMYFAYGSNLSAKRIHANNPTATRKGIGKLKDYRLDFGYYSTSWKGATATIVQDSKSIVWGAIWEIDSSDLENLDRQEGVELSIYKSIEVQVENSNNEVVKCRSYQLCEEPTDVGSLELLPEKRKPSRVYLSIIQEGALESNLPSDYIEKLNRIPHNGNYFSPDTVARVMLNE